MTNLATAPAPAGIPNFAWVDATRVARGQQPALTLAAYRELQALGFAGVLSLRPAIEYPEDERHAYDVAQERAICEALGLAFHHVPCTDFRTPHPSQLVRALCILQSEADRDRPLFVHCLAGVGRTGVVCGAWQMLHGRSGSDVLSDYARYCEEARVRRNPQQVSEAFQLRIGAGYQIWVLRQIALALGRPAELPAGFIAPLRPANAAGWRRRFREQLQRHLGATYGLTTGGPPATGGSR